MPYGKYSSYSTSQCKDAAEMKAKLSGSFKDRAEATNSWKKKEHKAMLKEVKVLKKQNKQLMKIMAKSKKSSKKEKRICTRSWAGQETSHLIVATATEIAAAIAAAIETTTEMFHGHNKALTWWIKLLMIIKILT